MGSAGMKLIRICLLLGIVAAPMAVWAQGDKLTPREQELLNTVQELQKRMGELEKQVETLKAAQPAPAPAAAPAAPSAAGDGKEGSKTLEERVAVLEEDQKSSLKPFWKDTLRLESPDGQFKLQIGGRLVTDWTWFGQDQELINSLGDEQDGVQFRTGRLNMQGDIYKDCFYRLEYDFAGNNGPTGFTDAYIGMRNIPYAGTLTVGHFKEPFSLEEVMNDSLVTFMERSLASTLAPSRNTGIQVSNALFGEPKKERMTWAVGAFKRTDNWPSANDSNEDQGYSFTGRITGLPWYEEDGRKLLHLGLAYSRRNPQGTAINRYQFQPWPENRLTQFRWLSTEGYAPFRLQDARPENVNLYGMEMALVYGPFSLQGEYMLDDVETAYDGSHTFTAYYAQASYFLTGENRIYKNATGMFDRVRPKNNFSWGKGAGAWELALRYSGIDLNDGRIRGGEESNLTAGVNWYLNPNLRLVLNYTLADISHDLYEGDMDILQARFQVEF